MNYFRLVRSGIDVVRLLEEVNANEHAWLIDTGRQDKIKVQRDTNTIFLSSPVSRPDLNVNENQEVQLTAVSHLFPRALAFMTEFAQEMDCQLSRATIVRLKPRNQVFRHIDQGSYYFLRDRYHLVLQSRAGSVMMSGGETVRMQEGELWWFDNKQYHESYNESDEWRIHYIFDLLPSEYSDLATNAILLPETATPQKTKTAGKDACPTPVAQASLPADLVRSAIRDRAILGSKDQPLIAPNGNAYSWMIDMRRLFLDPKILDAAAELFWQHCSGLLPFQVGGVEAAAIPLLTAIIMKSQSRGTPVNGFIIRKERKTYGSGKSIEGVLTDAPIVIVDDLLNSGRSLEKARVVLEQENRTIACAFVVIDYDSTEGKLWRERLGASVRAAFQLSEFGLSVEKPPSRPLTRFENRWRFASPNPNFFHRVPKSFPATDGKRVYFGSDCGTFWCLNVQDGSPAWTFKVNAAGHKNLWSSPALHDGRVYFGSYDGNVYCLDAATGRELWRFIGADWVGPSTSPHRFPLERGSSTLYSSSRSL